MHLDGHRRNSLRKDGFDVPDVSEFPKLPAAWYFFGVMSDLQSGPSARKILGRDLVAFKTESGAVAIIDARCSHLGANLGCGEVVGETIQCPFHHWCFGVDGVCKSIPAQTTI